MTAARLSLAPTLGKLRRAYTAESDSVLVPTVGEAINSFTTEDRALVREVLGAGFETRLLGENPLPPLSNRIRRAVLADATNPTQQQLEAGILYALGRISPYQWPETTVVAPMPVCEMVRPGDETATALNQGASAATPMIATLLPHSVDGNMRGLAGLRAQTHRRYVKLYLADSAATGSVALTGTILPLWDSMLGFARVVTGHEWPIPFEEPLTEPERAVIAAGRVPGPVPVASALLRRLRILGTTVWLTIHPDGPTGLRVSWSGGRTAAQVAIALVHPLTGLPGDRFVVTRATDGTVTVTSLGADGAEAARIVLHQAPLTAPPPFTRIDTTCAWSEFNRVMRTYRRVGGSKEPRERSGAVPRS